MEQYYSKLHRSSSGFWPTAILLSLGIYHLLALGDLHWLLKVLAALCFIWSVVYSWEGKRAMWCAVDLVMIVIIIIPLHLQH